MLKDADTEVVAEAQDHEQVLTKFGATTPTVCAIDIDLPRVGGLEVTRRLRELAPNAHVLLMGNAGDVATAARAIEAGALGLIGRDSEPDLLVSAIRAVSAGRTYLSDALVQQLALRRASRATNAVEGLSPREFEIMRLLAEGRPVSQVAELLDLSPRSVANYQTQIKHKLGVETTAALVHLALRHGLIQLGERWSDEPQRPSS